MTADFILAPPRPHWTEEFIRHANVEYRDRRREACGVIVAERGSWRYVPCRNLALDGEHFQATPEDVAAAEAIGPIVAIGHSHPNASPEPSEADRAMCNEWGVPWFIYGQEPAIQVSPQAWGHPAPEIRELRPAGYHPPLIGRVFEHGKLDCYSLVRDYFLEVLGIQLPDFARPDDWWAKGGNLYLDHFEEAGFADVTGQPLREHDVPLMQLKAPVPNHAGLILGNGQALLHHAPQRLSRRESYSGLWDSITVRVVRHRDLC